MSIRRTILTSITAMILFVIGINNSTATDFVTPLKNPNKRWACGDSGYQLGDGQGADEYFMYYDPHPALEAFHLGEDWNATCGANTEEGEPLQASGPGRVIWIRKETPSLTDRPRGFGTQIIVRYPIPYSQHDDRLLEMDILFNHLRGIASNISWNGAGTGTRVTAGRTLGYIGGTGDYIDSSGRFVDVPVHLHVEGQRAEADIHPYANPWVSSLTPQTAMDYLPHSLVISDLSDSTTTALPDRQWHFFEVAESAASSTTYITREGEKKTLGEASDAGWIYGKLVLSRDGGESWQYYPDIDSTFFRPGYRYAIAALVSGATLTLYEPPHTLQQDRARYDIMRAANAISSIAEAAVFNDELAYRHFPGWTSQHDLHGAAFLTDDNEYHYVYQATDVEEPLLRYTTTISPDGVQSPWRLVHPNLLW